MAIHLSFPLLISQRKKKKKNLVRIPGAAKTTHGPPESEEMEDSISRVQACAAKTSQLDWGLV